MRSPSALRHEHFPNPLHHVGTCHWRHKQLAHALSIFHALHPSDEQDLDACALQTRHQTKRNTIRLVLRKLHACDQDLDTLRLDASSAAILLAKAATS